MAGTIQLFTFVNEYLNVCKKNQSYKDALRCTGNHVQKFSEATNIPVYTNLNEQVIENFTYYLREQKLMTSTVKNNISRVKYLLKKARKAGYDTDLAIDDYTIPDEEANTVFFTMREVIKIHRFTNLTQREIEIKDRLVIGCLSALRYSDNSRLGTKNFTRNKISIQTQKTNTPVQIPIHPIIREILKKYNNQLPPPPTLQHFNREIKKICRKIGFTKKVLYERTIGHKRVSKLIPKYKLISSHTARRSAATNMYLAGIAPYRIMLITGHRTEKSFFRYIRITREENVKYLARHKFFTCKKNTLKRRKKQSVSA